ncbi:efflux RND transporter periplasmic adaptor subunit [Acidobacteria bacterium ACD]|nr:MAG: efflux RND transporter periplasmic adaptor subunit [Acidobacteriota bacterium]MDL1949865.1 efflux RND transporter periplasmic adaptor subunit [Acidobacteria bacterium ACD]
MTRNRALLLATLLLAPLSLSRCGKKADGKGGEGAGRPPVAVDTVRVAPADLEEAIDVVGTLVARREVEVKTEYTGTVAEVFVTQWVSVKAGTPLARLDTREAEAATAATRATVLQAEVGAARAARELDRTVKLKEAGLATQQGLDEARTAEEAARAALAAAKAQLALAETRLTKSVLRAPIDGVVAERGVNVGDYVENMGNPPPMFRIVDNSVLELTVTVPSARLPGLAVGQPLAFETDAVPGRTFEGRVSFINPAADVASRTVKVKAEVPNAGGALRTGLFVKGRIVTGRRTGVLSVPREALVSWDTAGRTGSLYVVDGGLARLVKVKTGAVAGGKVEVVEGLSGSPEVVTRGGFNLRDGDRVRTGAGA